MFMRLVHPMSVLFCAMVLCLESSDRGPDCECELRQPHPSPNLVSCFNIQGAIDDVDCVNAIAFSWNRHIGLTRGESRARLADMTLRRVTTTSGLSTQVVSDSNLTTLDTPASPQT